MPTFYLSVYYTTFRILFARTYPDTLWCYGNHDVSYPWGRLETGYSPYAERTVLNKLEDKQVVGHTPVERIFEKDGIISTDVFSTYRDGTQIGESAMIVIDSETGEYEKIDVPGKMGYRVYTAPADDIT